MGTPINMVDQAGRVVAVPEEAVADAAAAGYRVEAADESAGRLAQDVREETYGGVGGKAAALGAGVLRGATLGLSDVAFGALGGGQDLSALKEFNPITSTIGEIGGGLAASIAAPGSVLARTPTGVLSGFAARGVESARALGGVSGFVGQAAITGAEAAAQNVGSYLGSVALGDRDLTAEGLGGALGSGFAFGAAGGAAVYGIEKGTIAARRMFSSVMEGGEDAARSVGGNWERKFTELSQANDDTLAAAEQQLAAASQATQEAKLASQRAGQYVDEERVLAQRMAAPRAPEASLPDGFSMPSAGRAVDEVTGAPVIARNPEELAAKIREAREAKTALDRALQMERRVSAGDVPGEVGPFTPKGAKLAAQREIAREDVRAATGGFDFAPSTGKALREVEKTPNIARAPAAEAAPAAAGADDVIRTETHRVFPSSLRQWEVRTWRRGAVEPESRVVSTDDIDTVLGERLPDGFRVGGNFETRAPARIEYGIPEGKIPDNTLYVVRPSELAERGIAGNVLRDENLASVRAGWAKGEKLEPIEINLTPNGKLGIDDGNHRLHAAAASDRPVVVKFRNRHDIENAPYDLTDRLRAELASAKAQPTEVDPLMRALQGTKSQLDEGATLEQVGIGARAQPLSPRQLTDEVDRLTEAAAKASDIEAKQALLRRRSALEDQLAQHAPSTKALADIDSVTQAMHRYETAMADVADHIGDAAHPLTRELASGLRKAESDAERQMLDRAAQAIDDHSSAAAKIGEEATKASAQQTGGDAFGPAPMPPRERIAYAKARKTEADATYRKAAADETEARMGYKSAKSKAGEAARAAQTVGLPSPAAAETAGTGRALDVGGVLELAGMAGIPGLPRPSDLPIVGPLIGLYLKARAIGGVAGRLMGRVPASGNAKAAMLAAQVKDRAAHAVDRMLGHVERATPTMRTVAAVAGPRLVEAVRDRLHDDGTKAPAKDASLQEHVAARSREITALVADPALIAKQVSKEMRDVADPDMVNAAIAFRTNQLKYLERVAPKEPPPSPFQRGPWKPPRDQATDFARRYAVAMDPVQALEQVEQKRLTPEAAEAYRAVYPKLFAQTQMRLIEKATTLQTTLPRAQLTRMSILFDLPLDSALEPGRLSRTQSVFAATSPQDQGAPPTGPVASIAGPTNLGNIYQTVSDRRAAR